MFVYYKLKDGQLRPAVLVKHTAGESKADLHVFLTKNDYGKGVHENHVRRGFAQLQDVKQGTTAGTWNWSQANIDMSEPEPEAETPASPSPKTSKRSKKKK